jgi:hypothetical protein
MTLTAVEANWDTAWLEALADLELEVDRAEALLKSAEIEPPEVSQWAPPVGLGPLPAELLDRAKALHAKQMRVTQAIMHALTHNRAQAAVAARMETGHVAPRPVYVDSSC